MALELQQHQQDAYDNVKKHFEEGDKSIVIFPTGCGKSFVSLKLIEDNRDSKILFVCPSAAIKNQMYGYIINYLSTEETNERIKSEEARKHRALGLEEKVKIILPNFKVVLYQTIISKSKKTQEILDKLEPDYIICDEVQHIKTRKTSEEMEQTEEEHKKEIKRLENVWGAAMVEFSKKNPQAKILGITATPERSDGVNVAVQFFDGKVASEISLIEALTSDDIPVKAPDYIPCTYTLINEIDEKSIQEQIEGYKITDPERAQELQRKLEELRKIADSGKGIPDLFTEHLTTPEAKELGRDKGKYIVFCDNIEDMKQKMEEAKTWFSGVDSEPEIYAVSSEYNKTHNGEENITSESVISDFENAHSGHIKLLFSVNMLNEGLHVDDVSGVIMARKTNSRNLYLQQLGRAIYSNPDKPRPIVFDIANNYLTYNIYYELASERKKALEIADIEETQKFEKDEAGTDVYDGDKWMEAFKIDGIMRDLLDLLEEQDHKENAVERFINKLYILKKHGVDTSKIKKRDTIRTLAENSGYFDMKKLQEDGLNLDDRIGETKIGIVRSCRGRGRYSRPTEEQIKELLAYGIVLEEQSSIQDLLDKLKKLKRRGMETFDIKKNDTIRTLVERYGNIDPSKLEEDGLDLDYKIGHKLVYVKRLYRDSVQGNQPTKEEFEEFLTYGIVLEKQEKNATQDFIEKIEILIRHGVDVTRMTQKDTIRTLAEKTKNIDLHALEEEGLDLDDKIGSSKSERSKAYRGREGLIPPTEEQVNVLLKYGITLEKQEKNMTQYFIDKLKILRKHGVDVCKITTKDTIRTLAEKTEGIDLSVLEEDGLDLDDKIGTAKSRITQAFRGRGHQVPPTEEQVRELLEYGIILEKKVKSKDLGQATYEASALECDEAASVVNGLLQEKDKQQSPVDVSDSE